MASAFGFSLTSVAAKWPFMAMRWVKKLYIPSGVSEGLKMVELLCIVADGLVMLLAYLFWGCGKGLLKWSDGLGRSLGFEVGMWLVDFGWLFTWWLVVGLWLEEAGHFRVGMWLCLDCLIRYFWVRWAVCGGVLEDGLIMGLSLLLGVLKWEDLAILMVLEWGYLNVQMVLERVLCMCVWGRCCVCCGDMFCLVLLSCSCEV